MYIDFIKAKNKKSSGPCKHVSLNYTEAPIAATLKLTDQTQLLVSGTTRVFLHRGLSSAGVVESGGSDVMIHEIANPFPCVADLPTFRQWVLIL